METNLSDDLIKHPIKSFTTFNHNPRPWHMPLMAGLAISFPVFVGVYFGNLAMGLLASLGAMVFLNLPYVGSLIYRMTAVLACSFGMVACFYSLLMLWQNPAKAKNDVALPSEILGDTIIVSLFVALSLWIALILNMPKPYWVPMSCLVVIQGMNFQSIWTKHIHRILGTAIGMGVAWALLTLHPQGYGVAFSIFAMLFCIETFVVRHYGLAVIFITPLTIFLAEYSTPNPSPIAEIISTRLWDTVLGCFIGVLGGLVILSPTIKQKLQIVVDKILAKIEI